MAPRRYHRLHSLCNGPGHDGVGVVGPVCQEILGRQVRRQRLGPACSPPPCPRSEPTVPAFRGHQRPDAVCCSAPLVRAMVWLPPTCTCPMGMHLDMAGVNHQPLKVRVIDHAVQEAATERRGPASGKTGDEYSSSPRNRAAGHVKVHRCVESRTLHSETVDCPVPAAPPCQPPQEGESAAVSKPAPKGRADDAMLSYAPPHTRSLTTAIYHYQLDLTTLPKPIPKWDVHFGGLADDRKTPRHLVAPLGPNRVSTDSAVWRYVHFTLALV